MCVRERGCPFQYANQINQGEGEKENMVFILIAFFQFNWNSFENEDSAKTLGFEMQENLILNFFTIFLDIKFYNDMKYIKWVRFKNM